jgi:hypothetical protein
MCFETPTLQRARITFTAGGSHLFSGTIKRSGASSERQSGGADCQEWKRSMHFHHAIIISDALIMMSAGGATIEMINRFAAAEPSNP